MGGPVRVQASRRRAQVEAAVEQNDGRSTDLRSGLQQFDEGGGVYEVGENHVF